MLLLPQDSFNPLADRERTTGDSWLIERSEQNPFPPPSLAKAGEEAIRFSSAPAWSGGQRNIVTITPNAKGEAIASLDTVRHQCDSDDRTRCSLVLAHMPSFAFCIEGDCSYAGTANRIHGLLFDRARMSGRKIGLAIPVPCTHGPGHLTELREKGITHNLEGFCGREHPNNSIYKLVRQGAGIHWQLIGAEPAEFGEAGPALGRHFRPRGNGDCEPNEGARPESKKGSDTPMLSIKGPG